MKDKILIFIIGLLVGAIITASGFLIYQKTNKNNIQTPNGEQMQMMEKTDGKEPPQMPNGETPPEKPDSTANSNNKKEHPSKNKSSSDENKTN